MGPLGEVLDGGEIEIAVGTNFAFSGPVADEVRPGDVFVVRTRQPFGEIAGRLQRGEGYEETPDGLLHGGEPIELHGELRIASSYDEIRSRPSVRLAVAWSCSADPRRRPVRQWGAPEPS